MAYTVKHKIRGGTLFLFLLLMLLGGVGIFHIVRLKNDSQIILKDNYESLDYCHAMQRAMDAGDLLHFDSALRRQELNLTEVGESEATKAIRENFDKYRSGNQADTVTGDISAHIQKVIRLNMLAIELKNRKATETADQALTYILLIAAVIFLVGLTFTVNFPSVLTQPLRAIISGIKEIASKNYKYRIHLDRKDEFGQMAKAFNDMAERLEYFENSNLNKLIFEKNRAEAVINSLKDASIGIDKTEKVLFANRQALQLLGLQPGEIVGMPVPEVMKKNDLFRFLVEDKGGMPFKIVVEGRENYFIKELIDIGDDGSAGKLVVLRNITSFKELDVAKTNFIATVSHELKTPLASSDFSIKLLEDRRTGSLNPEQQKFVMSLREDNQRMLRILSELLNMAQLEAGKLQLNIAVTSPYLIADNAVDSVAGFALEKRVTITTDYDSDLPPVSADPDKTVWVLNNFLTNAIKYSRPRTDITLKLKRTASGVQFSVSDKGVGIAADQLGKIFERFYRVPGSTVVGNGLGLSISKEFIESQNSRIWVKSELGKGAIFGFELKP